MSTTNEVKILIQFNGKEIKIPVNPEEMTISKKAQNQDIDILGIGKATRKADPSLITTKIKSFFPSTKSQFYIGTEPILYIDFINEIWNTENINNNVAKIITTGLEKNLNMFFVIESFNYSYSGGDDDVEFDLAIKEYKPYGVQITTNSSIGMASARAASPAISQDTSVQNLELATYTVQSGDCLWNITKACCGDGSRYAELYDLNKSVIGNSPNFIKPGQVLTLPYGWSTPTNVTKLKNVTKSNPPSTGTTNNNNDVFTANAREAAAALANATSIGFYNDYVSNESSSMGGSGGGHSFDVDPYESKRGVKGIVTGSVWDIPWTGE